MNIFNFINIENENLINIMNIFIFVFVISIIVSITDFFESLQNTQINEIIREFYISTNPCKIAIF